MDIELIFENCRKYNKEESEIYELANKLELFFRKIAHKHLKYSSESFSKDKEIKE